jgi:Domain of unknown function (DUF4398)
MTIIKMGMAVAVMALGFGCGASTLPTDQLASTEASVRAAQELGATNVPNAELHLRLANEQLAEARKRASNGDDKEATRLLQRARADAELAVSLAREEQARKDYDQVSKSAVNAPDPAVSAAR